MQDTATLIAHILFKQRAVQNMSTVLRNLDTCLDRASNGAFALAWDGEEVMVATFAQTKVILVTAPHIISTAGFTFTIAVSPKDVDAIANPTLARFHKNLALDLVRHFEQPNHMHGVMWQRAAAPISAEAVERIAETLAETLTRLNGTADHMLAGHTDPDSAPLLPASALTLQSGSALPM